MRLPNTPCDKNETFPTDNHERDETLLASAYGDSFDSSGSRNDALTCRYEYEVNV